MDESVTRQIIIEIQDHLAPRLDSYEQMLYHYLFRHTHLEGKASTTIGIRTLQTRVGLGVGQAGSPPSQAVVMKKLRSLEHKGCIEIVSRSYRGTELRVLLPREIPGVIPQAVVTYETPLEALGFFTTPELRLSLLRRENYQCFYCLRQLTEDSYTVDHIVAQADGGAHSYKNVVACCFECNSRKQDNDGKSFLLTNYRSGFLTADEHQKQLTALETVANGRQKPDISNIV